MLSHIPSSAVRESFRLSGVLRTFSRLGEIGVGGLQHRVLIAVSELSRHGSVAVLTFFFLLQSSFESVLI